MNKFRSYENNHATLHLNDHIFTYLLVPRWQEKALNIETIN